MSCLKCPYMTPLPKLWQEQLTCSRHSPIKFAGQLLGTAQSNSVRFLLSGTVRMKAHRSVLSACSEYFRTLFTSKLAASPSLRAGIVHVDLEPRILKTILNFIYTGTDKHTHFIDLHNMPETQKAQMSLNAWFTPATNSISSENIYPDRTTYIWLQIRHTYIKPKDQWFRKCIHICKQLCDFARKIFSQVWTGHRAAKFFILTLTWRPEQSKPNWISRIQAEISKEHAHPNAQHNMYYPKTCPRQRVSSTIEFLSLFAWTHKRLHLRQKKLKTLKIRKQ